MVNKNERLRDCVTTIFDEVVRLNDRLAKGGIGAIDPGDTWFALPNPDPKGIGEMIAGRLAGQRFEELALEAANRAGLSRRANLGAVRKHLAELLVQRFVREGRPVDTREVARALSAAGKAARGELVTLTHLVPCHLMLAADPDELRIGPVVFRNRAGFEKLIRKPARDYRLEGSDDERAVSPDAF